MTRLTSKQYAGELRKTISLEKASRSSPTNFSWPVESKETTHLSVVDSDHNAVSLTYTLEESYGSGIVVPGAGFLLNNEMGDFNASPGLTTTNGLIGTAPNLAAPGKRMLSSMSPTIVARDGKLLMATGSPGGRTIINTVLLTILNVVDFGMNAQEANDAPRFHHQWLPDRIQVERGGLSASTLNWLRQHGHTVSETGAQGAAQIIVVNGDKVGGGRGPPRERQRRGRVLKKRFFSDGSERPWILSGFTLLRLAFSTVALRSQTERGCVEDQPQQC